MHVEVPLVAAQHGWCPGVGRVDEHGEPLAPLGGRQFRPGKARDELRGESADERADVYGLGMTAVFCVHRAPLTNNVIYEREEFMGGLRCSPAIAEVLRILREHVAEPLTAEAPSH